MSMLRRVVWAALAFMAQLVAPLHAEIRITLDPGSGEVVGLQGLSQAEVDECPLAQGVGRVADRRMARDGRTIVGVTFVDDRFGRAYVNLDPPALPPDPAVQASIRRGLQQLLAPGQRLRLGVRGCGVSGGTEYIDSVALAAAPATVSRPDPPAGPARPAAWTYGVHPVLGLSAHVTVEAGAFGLACGFPGPAGPRTDTLSLRITPGLVPNAEAQPGPLLMLEGTGQVGATSLTRRGSYLEYRHESCEVPTYRRAQSVMLFPGVVESADVQGATTIARIRQGSRIVVMTDGRLAEPLTDAVRIPTVGAGPAIQRLINACQAIRENLRCGD